MFRFIVTIILLYCSSQVIGQNKKVKYLQQIDSLSQFELLQNPPISSKYGMVKAVKVVYNLEDSSIYYVNGKRYKYHHGFCSYQLNYTKGLDQFNEENYSANNDKRKYLLANVNYYKSLNKYIVDLSPADLMTEEEITFLIDKIEGTTYFGENIYFFKNTQRLKDATLNIKTITPEEIYENQTFQALGIAEKYGYLKFVALDSLMQTQLTEKDIVVLDKTPLFFPLVNGIIASQFQTPLSHLSLLGQNRAIPIMALKDAWNNPILRKLEGKYVKLTVQEDDYFIRSSEYDEKHHKPTKEKQLKLKADLSIDTLVRFNNTKKISTSSIGNKARNFGILQNIAKNNDFTVPENAFAIPFYFYQQHALNSGAHELIHKLITDTNKYTSQELDHKLNAIQEKIKNYPIDKALLNLVSAELSKHPEFAKYRFRSSTNAEDMEGFNGAGLYLSKSGKTGNKTSIEKAIKKVWASLWSYNAYMERFYYHIDQSNVYMGVLVHRSFPDEAVNGVAITTNIYRKSALGFIINAQLGNENVVNPTKGITCDQVVCYETENTNIIYGKKEIIEVITTSSLNNGKLTMTNEEIVKLTHELDAIKKYFYHKVYNKTDSYAKFGLDIEFKLDKDRNIYIKQARPFNN